jgi:hypothetical protein
MKTTKNNNHSKFNNEDVGTVFNSTLISWLWKVCQWLNKFYLSQPGVLSDLLPLLHTLDRVLCTRGKAGFVTYVKDLRRAFYGYLSGNQESKGGVKCTKDGIPVVLGNMIPRLRRAEGATETCRILTTILVVSRCLNVGTSPDISSITSPCSKVRPSVGGSPWKFWKELGYTSSKGRVPRGVYWKNCHLTTKTGPNGHALWYSLIDLQVIDAELWKDLYVLGGDTFRVKCDTLRKCNEMKLLPEGFQPIALSNVKDPRLRKISWFPDKEDKVRIIAILDYWSQSVLRNLHSYLFRVLRKIPQDCTFDQGLFKDRIKGWSRFHSLDLTAATDRFPISIICEVLEGHFPKSYVSSWRNVMTGRPFRWTTKQGTEEVTYEVGNPMGAYSSWATFTLSHHYVVFQCCKNLGIEWATAKYCLLGDDILIGDDALSEEYLRVMESIGVEISKPKTHRSSTFAEFAKRLFYRGEEISPFPLSALKQSARRYYQLVNLLMECEKKGWVTTDTPLCVSGFYGFLYNRPSRNRKVIRENSIGCQAILRCMQSPSLAPQVLSDLARHWNYSLDWDYVSWEEILGESLWLAFTKSLDQMGRSSGAPLGDLARDLLLNLTEPTDSPERDSLRLELIYCLPVLNVYGQIEQSYVRLRKEAEEKRWAAVLQGGLMPFLRVIALPSSDQVFSQRRRDTKVFASAIISKNLRLIFKSLEWSEDTWVSAKRPKI